MVVRTDFVMPPHTVKLAKTASGEGFHSDGRTAILYLTRDEDLAEVPGTAPAGTARVSPLSPVFP